MRGLGLFVDAGVGAADVDGDVGVNVDVDIGFPRFKNPTKISVGVSDIKAENVVALLNVPLASLSVGRRDRVRGDVACGS
jgi:hypothetical protein